jgi:hypothetical protein
VETSLQSIVFLVNPTVESTYSQLLITLWEVCILPGDGHLLKHDALPGQVPGDSVSEGTFQPAEAKVAVNRAMLNFRALTRPVRCSVATCGLQSLVLSLGVSFDLPGTPTDRNVLVLESVPLC